MWINCRRRKAEKEEDLPRVVFENPYYGEVTRPLTEGHEDSDEGGEKTPETKTKYFQEDLPRNQYDIPPSMSLSNPTYGAQVMLTGMEGAYDVVRTRKVPEYDCPPKPLPCFPGNDWCVEPEVENLYESLENLKAALAEKDVHVCCTDKPAPAPEEERYVVMGNVAKQPAVQAWWEWEMVEDRNQCLKCHVNLTVTMTKIGLANM